MTIFIFENWPDTGDELRLEILRLVNRGWKMNQIIHEVRKTFIRTVLLKMRNESMRKIALRCGTSRTGLDYWINKYNLKEY